LLNARNVPALNAHRPAQTRLRAPVDWQSTEAWLSADGTAELDLLGNYAVAERLAAIVTSADGARSIGIVGAFGAGKSTIVEWMRGIVEREKNALGLTVVFSTHSCWGFDNSASAIHEILADAVKRVGEHIDTFYVSSLPESYVRAFSTSGKWADGLSRLFLRARGPIEQFQSLSDLLRCANARLVFIIEDLDRNESRSFDGQEILAFLQQLKTFANFSFVLTGGLAANGRVDYSKLCEHIEYLSAVNVRQAMELVRRVRGGCLASAGGPRETFATPFDDVWSETLPVLTEPDLLHPRGAVASLLGTPRALQRVLARTHRSWGRLAGEIDFDSLLAVNVLRDAAHEAFSFVLRNWQMLRAAPPDRALAAR
jgi:energy-coupling factor transporter ATP-binding protein EcfA2